MKYKLALVLVAMFTLISCKDRPNPKEDSIVVNQTPNKAANNLKEVITSAYAIKDSAGTKVKDSVQLRQSITYNAKGQEHSNIFYNLDGSKQWEDVYTYNQNGNKNGSKYYEDGRHMITYKYELDAQGRRVAYTAYEATAAVPMYSGYSEFNQDNTLRKDGNKNASGIITWNYEYSFTKDGEDLGYVYIDIRNGARYPSFYRVLKRNANNQWIERAIVENDSIVGIETRQFIYN